MSGNIAQKATKKREKKNKEKGIDLKSAYSAFISAYRRKVEKKTKEQENVDQNI